MTFLMAMAPCRRESTPARRTCIWLHGCAAIILALACVAAVPRAAQSQPAPGSAHRAAIEVIALSALSRGQFDRATEIVGELGDADVFRLLIEGQVLLERGDSAGAIVRWERASVEDPFGEAALRLGLLRDDLGQPDEAAPVLAAVVERGAAAGEAAGLARAARAARALGQYRLANSLFRNALKLAPDDASINAWWGELFLEKHNTPEAQALFNAALEADPDHAPARLGLARSMADENPAASGEQALRALAANPMLADAHVHLARLAADGDRFDEAHESLSRALEINPAGPDALALRAALARVQDRLEEFHQEAASLAAIRPSSGEAYRQAADALAHRYRFDEALEMAERAVELEPGHARAGAELGLLLLRTGDEARARAILDRAFEQDPFDVVTYNLLGLLDTLAKFETIDRPGVRVKLHPDEAPVLSAIAPDLAAEALESLSARYGFEPRGPVLVEIFPRHDDFAVRTLGLPGMVGALGACFGRVVTLDSPRARPPGTFSWEATLWHEIAHVITLQMSAQRVPRWLSEGISVFEERRARPGWGRESHEEFLRAYAAGRMLPLASLGGGFTDPTTVTLAYHQASVVVDHLVEQFGEPAVHRLLRAFGDGLDEPAALRRALAVDFDGLQASFDAYLDRRYGRMRTALATPEGAAEAIASGDPAALARAAEEHPESFDVQMALGAALAEQQDLRAALEAFARADALVPGLAGSESPRASMASIAERLGDIDTAKRSLDALLEHDPTALDAARQLARLAEASGDRQRERTAHARIVSVAPFDAGSHAALGRLAIEDGEIGPAVQRLELALRAEPDDPSVVHTDLAEALVLAGQPVEAKRQVIAALEIAPRYARAQDLLLRLVDGGGGASRR